MYVEHAHAWCPQKSEDGIGSPGTGAMDGHEAPCKCSELNPTPLEKQQMFSTTEQSLQLPVQS